jgi:hypothetical protein
LITLHFSQRGLTDADTFISGFFAAGCGLRLVQAPGARPVMRPRV